MAWLLLIFSAGSDLDTVPVRDSRSRNGTPDSGWDDDDDDLDLAGLGKTYEYQRSWLFLKRRRYDYRQKFSCH